MFTGCLKRSHKIFTRRDERAGASGVRSGACGYAAADSGAGKNGAGVPDFSTKSERNWMQAEKFGRRSRFSHRLLIYTHSERIPGELQRIRHLTQHIAVLVALLPETVFRARIRPKCAPKMYVRLSSLTRGPIRQ